MRPWHTMPKYGRIPLLGDRHFTILNIKIQMIPAKRDDIKDFTGKPIKKRSLGTVIVIKSSGKSVSESVSPYWSVALRCVALSQWNCHKNYNWQRRRYAPRSPMGPHPKCNNCPYYFTSRTALSGRFSGVMI